MRETIGSLKQYLVFFGLIGALTNLQPLLRGVAAVPAAMLAGNIALSVCFMLLGARIRVILSTAPQIAFRVFYVTIAWSLTCACLAYLLGDEARATSNAILGGLLASYFLVTIRRIVATNLIVSGR